MLCNKCGHSREAHWDGFYNDCRCPGCPCRSFVPPGDAEAYQSKSVMRREAIQRGGTEQIIREAIDETRDIVNQIPASYFHLLKVKQAADKLADAAKRSGGSEELQVAIHDYERVSRP